MGRLRQRFLSDLGLPFLPRPGHLPPWADTLAVVPHQVRRDIEQLEHLVREGVVGDELGRYLEDVALPEYRELLAGAEQLLDGQEDAWIDLDPQKDLAVFFGLQGRALHLHEGGAVPGGAVSETVDLDAVQERFLRSEHRVAVMDDFFTGDFLHALRRFLLESTMWLEAKPGYVGAYLDTGFASPLVSQLDRELRARLPRVLGGLELTDCWAYMYDGSLGGVGTHADDAQVQLNFFVTPSEANLWSEDASQPSGGLVVYGVGPPDGWDFDDYNSLQEDPRIEGILAAAGNWNLTVPYVQNRAIMFDSTYFHRTDEISFRPGYKNRRINLTFLYGKRRHL